MSAGLKWILAIVGLLVANLVAMGILIGAASADRPQVVPEYYDRAVHYDDQIDQAAANRALGWHVAVAWGDELAISVRDGHGAALTGARVQVAGADRATGTRGFDRLLLESTPGTYVLPGTRKPGIYDVAVVVALGKDTFVERMAVEAK